MKTASASSVAKEVEMTGANSLKAARRTATVRVSGPRTVEVPWRVVDVMSYDSTGAGGAEQTTIGWEDTRIVSRQWPNERCCTWTAVGS